MKTIEKKQKSRKQHQMDLFKVHTYQQNLI